MLTENTTVLDLKQHVARKEGVSPDQQLLMFAGRQLFPDSALLLDHLALDSYSLAHEVVVYMQRQLSEPLRIYLCHPGTAPTQQQAEMVEASSTLSNIMNLLTTRHLSTRPFPTTAAALGSAAPAAANKPRAAGLASAGGTDSAVSSGSAILPSCVVVKRQDGSCSSKVHVTEDCTVQQLVETIEQVEGVSASHLTFYQAPDGCLHVVYGPSADPCVNTHTVYSRSCKPQPPMQVKGPGSSNNVPYSSLVKEQAVMP
eukprot:GHUV01051626.1.p1 GENE.GHUV01051626.1~~GHUV01051626.1.p1  ORF type:complete len:257 (+),score=87.20 GHUV01051626.1:404-1174(+)